MTKTSSKKINKWLIIIGTFMGLGLIGNLLEKKEQKQIDQRMGTICHFTIWKSENTDFGSRKRRAWRVTIERAEKPEDYGATLVHLAKELQKQSDAQTVSVIVEMTRESIQNGISDVIGSIHYIPDEKGFSGQDDSKKWDIRVPTGVPSDELIQAYKIKSLVKEEARKQFPDEFQKHDEMARTEIAKQMGISYEDADQLLIEGGVISFGKKYNYQGEKLSFKSSDSKAHSKRQLRGQK